MLRITIELDNVLANIHGKLVEKVLTDFETKNTREDYAQKSLKTLLHIKQYNKLYANLGNPGFFLDLDIMPHSTEVLKRLMQYYEVFISSSTMQYPHSIREKYDWITERFPFIPRNNIVFCGNKNIIAAEYLIDAQLDSIASFSGKGILFSTLDNRHEAAPTRVNDWKEIEELFLAKS